MMIPVQRVNRQLLKPLPGRLISVLVAVGCLVILWGSVLKQDAPSHAVATLLLITTALSSFHAFGWRSKYQLERWLLSPVGSLVLIATIVYLQYFR